MNGLNSNDRELLARLIERFNQIESNAKRIDELPAVSSLVGDSKLHVSVNGISYSMTVQELLSAIESRKYDHITFINDLEINGNTLTADSAGWVIQDVVYNLTNPFEGTIPYASVGFQRTDLLIANTNNEFLVIQGDENEGISFAPPLPPNTVLVTTLDVTDNAINSTPNPIGSDNFKIKNESNFTKATGNNTNDYIEGFSLNTEASHIVLESIIEIKSLVFREGFKAYPGKQIFITNNGPNNLKIKANHSSNVKFVFPNNQDYIAKPKETVVFYLSDDLSEVFFLSTNLSATSNNNKSVSYMQSLSTRETLTATNTWKTYIASYTSANTSFWNGVPSNDCGTGELPIVKTSAYGITLDKNYLSKLEYILWQDVGDHYTKRLIIYKADIRKVEGSLAVNHRIVSDFTITNLTSQAHFTKILVNDLEDTPEGYNSIYTIYIKDIEGPTGYTNRYITWNFSMK